MTDCSAIYAGSANIPTSPAGVYWSSGNQAAPASINATWCGLRRGS